MNNTYLSCAGMRSQIRIPIWPRRATPVLVVLLGMCSSAFATTYTVGPGQSYATLGAVPWYKLASGDVVNIEYNGGCYAEKFLISTQGTSWSNPITVQGITDGEGHVPCITGLNAVQSTTSKDRWSGAANAQYSESLYVVGISLQANLNYGPAYVILSNLEITGAAQGASYTADDGSKQPYGSGVAAVRIINGDHIKVQNCYIHGIAGNGIFGEPNNSFPGTMADIQLYYNHIAANGVAGNYLYHNSYLEADQSTYIGNLFEPLVAGGPGSHLKDRSAGTIVAYNRFHGSAARYIDLVEPQAGWSDFGSKSYYGSDFVYGNVFEAWSTDPNFNQVGTMIHYGGDQGQSQYYRNKTLSYYDNTLVVTADVANAYKMGLFEPDVPTAAVDLSNNILLFTPHTQGSATPELDIAANNNGSPVGTFVFYENWISPGWKICFTGGSCLGGTVTGTQNVISPSNNNPGFSNLGAQDYTLASGSTALGVASALPSLIVSNPQGGNFTPTLQYLPDLKTVARSSLKDLGAFAAASGGCSYSVSPGSLSDPSGATISQLALVAGGSCGWNASSSASWLSVSPSSGTGSGTLSVTAQANTTSGSRSAEVTVQSQQITVTQAAPTTCTYQVNPGSLSLPSGANTSHVTLVTGSTCTWKASSSASWLSVTAAAGTGDATISVSLQANTTSASRTATVTVQSQQIKVTQAAPAKCSYLTSPGSVSLSSGGFTSPLALVTGSTCPWTASSSASWLTVSKSAGTASATINITALANTTSASRSATVTVQAQPITVTQAAPGGTNALGIDVTRSVDQGSQSSTIQTPTFSTSAANELLLAFISTDYLSGANTTVTGISSAGNTWQLVKRANGQSGDSEIWRAFASSPLTNISVKASLSQPVAASMTIITFTGANSAGTDGSGAIGAVASASGSSGAPTAQLVTTKSGSWVIGVGNDYTNSLARTAGSNQTLVHQYFPPVGDTYWVQRQTAPTPSSGTTVKINDSWPTGDQFNLAICEILPQP